MEKQLSYDLTPIQFWNGNYWKRDDFFKPFGEFHVNGGKVRQALEIFESKIEEIKTKYNNGVVTAASVHSPQSANIAKVAELFNIKCISCVGGTKLENLNKLAMMRLTKHYGSEIRIVAGHGMTPVIHARMHEIAKNLSYLPIEMGELMEENPKSIFETTAEQVKNIPDELDLLIVPTGIAIQLTGILIGLNKFDKKVKRIVSVCVGPTREKQVENYITNIYQKNINDFFPFEMVAHKAAYSKSYDVVVNGTYIDDIYEGKAYDWMIKNTDYKNLKTLFWCVGKRPRETEVEHIIKNKL